MNRLAGVSLQINLAPTDLPTAVHVLPHQLRQWGSQVDEILLVMDLHRSRGRFAEAWTERLPGMRRLLDECCHSYSHARSVDVDYSQPTVEAVADRFFGTRTIPAKDWRGGPFYSYFFGLHAASFNQVLHMDSDMMYGGGSSRWVREAVGLMWTQPNIVACNPLPGPPTTDGGLRSQRLRPYRYSSPAFQSPALSSRHFILDRDRFMRRVGRLRLTRPPRPDVLKAVLDGNPPYNPPEIILSEAMAARQLIRVDFLGSPPGMWGVHPPYRNPRFFETLPSLIQEIESGSVPEAQRGHHDLNASMVDWSGTQPSTTQKIGKHLRLAAARFRSE